jgi:hypothetical protein
MDGTRAAAAAVPRADALAVLGLAPGASHRQIKLAFRRAAKRLHPDHRGRAEGFVALREAYEAALRAPEGPPAEPLSLQRGEVGALDRSSPCRPCLSGPRTRSPRPAPWFHRPVDPVAVVDLTDIARPPPVRAGPSRPAGPSFEDHLVAALARSGLGPSPL